MKTIPRFPYFPVQFNKAGQGFSPAEVQALEQHLASAGTTDLLVMSHGWNNDSAEAESLYESFLSNADIAIRKEEPPGLGTRKFAVLGVLWPSKKFADKELIPSGAAGIAGTVASSDLVEKLKSLAGAFDAPDEAARIERLKSLVPKLEDSESACRQFAEEARKLVSGTGDPVSDAEDGSETFRSMDPADLFERMSQPVSFVSTVPSPEEGGAAGIGIDEGGAAGMMDFVSGALSGARNVLNFTTYYQMKERAGKVGVGGVNPLLRSLQAARPGLRLHLIGHSFGGRLVAATASAGGIRVSSLSLLQAAFSHYGLSPDWDGHGNAGAFRPLFTGKVISGPVVVTCTPNDKAVGVAYPMASLLAGHTASGIGDENSEYGGIGRNGAQKTPEVVKATMHRAGQPYAFQSGRIYNLRADPFVMNHSDVTNPNVVFAVLSAIAAAS